MCNLKYDVNELIYPTETDSQREQICDCQGMGGDRIRSLEFTEINYYT